MSNYAKITDFAIKDTLATGDADKRVRGSEIDAEFEALETAIATKADLASPALTGSPTAPTQAAGNNTTRIATTAFVTTAVANSLAGDVQTAIDAAINDNFPIYSIIMWYGSTGTIPAGWFVCDGSTHSTIVTPNLQDRFPIGAGSTYAKGATGGSADAIVVSHTHTFSGNTGTESATHTHAYTAPQINPGGISFGGGGGTPGTTSTGTESTSHTHAYSGTTSSSGASGTGANLPPYLAVYFIMKCVNYAG